MRAATSLLFGPLTNRQRAALQDRQLAECGELQRDQAAARDELAERLQRQYGQSLRENQRALNKIEQRHRQMAEELENRLDGLRGAGRRPSRFPNGCGRSTRRGIGTKVDRSAAGALSGKALKGYVFSRPIKADASRDPCTTRMMIISRSVNR